GAFAAVRAHVDQGLAFYDPQTHSPAVSDAVHDPEGVGRCVAAGALWHLGYPEQARQHLETALTRAQELAHPFTLAQVLYWATMFALVRREVQVAREQVDALITLATAQGFPFELAGGQLGRGLVLTEQGRPEEGMQQIRQGGGAPQANGGGARPPHSPALFGRGGPRAWALWRGAMGTRARVTKGSRCWTRRSRTCTVRVSGATRRSCIGSKVSCCSREGKAPQRWWTWRSVFVRPSPSPSASRPKPWSCGRR